MKDRKPNVVFVFADQWRAQAAGYAGDPNVKTPNLDVLATESIQFHLAVAGCPVCCAWRASFITGRYPLTHGVFLNDLCLSHDIASIADAFNEAGYDTAYIGKWHLDGHGRSSFIPRERRQGFQFWKAMECTHDYNNSDYYADENLKLKWHGYDAIAQTREAQRYVREHPRQRPFFLVLSWGPPHNPYETAPKEYRRWYKAAEIILRPNVPKECAEAARADLAGYYAHISALDACVGGLRQTLKECGLANETLFVFTSDHGDVLGSHGQAHKQLPYDEAILVPFLLRYPAALGTAARTVEAALNTPDIMPTLLGLCGIEAPSTVEGLNYADLLRGGSNPGDNAALITCPAPFGQWPRPKGGREYRGVRTFRYSYVRDLDGPWLLFDNENDPHQLDNLCGRPEHSIVQRQLEETLQKKLRETNDEFLPAENYIKKWGYKTDETGTVPYTD